MSIGGKKGSRTWNYLDDEQCFTLWNQLSSLGETRRQLIIADVKNPKTGKPPTTMAIRVAALRYAIRNPEKGRLAITQAEGGEWAEDRTMYYQWLNHECAAKVLSKSKYAEFLVEIEEFLKE
jgi:hypothetical protein